MSEQIELRPFQIKVLNHLMKGRRVILQAPTGAGKTRAALDPFLLNLASGGDNLPHTCRYVVPMRVLANQFFREYESAIQRIDSYQGVDTRLQEKYQRLERPISAVQTGEQPNDPQFESVLTFCTVDQLLASALAIPYGLGNSLANLNVGAVLSSYLIFDEFHLYPLSRDNKSVFGARTTVLQLLRLLKPITPFVLMTATFSSTLLQELATLLDAEIVDVTDEELKEIAQGRARTFTRSAEPMNAATILAEHMQRPRNRCTLIVCNTVLRAQKLFLELKCAENQGTRVVLLHSRFTQGDRRRLSEEVEKALGTKQWKDGVYYGPDIIVIATQVVEVGLNISVEVLHTENAPASSLIQRAGRCARFAQQQGRVLIYPLPTDEHGQASSTAPYDKDTCANTWEKLEPFDGKEVGFRQEQQLIDAVHTEEDKALLTGFEANERDILDNIFKSLREHDRGVATDFIRDISQVQVLIHDVPEKEITKNPWNWESFNLRPTTFLKKGRWDWMQEQAQERKWACKQLRSLLKEEEEALPDGADGLDNQQQRQIDYTWETVTNPAQIQKALMVALPSEVATYDAELGFLFRDDFPDYVPTQLHQSRLLKSKSNRPRYVSRETSYQDHIAGLAAAYYWNLQDHLKYAARKLEQEMELPTEMVEHAILLAIACHDLGKLNTPWQEWAYAWQKLRHERLGWETYELPSPDFCFAKTDNDDTKEERNWQRDVRPRRPHHSCESVALGSKLISASLSEALDNKKRLPVLRAICGAIARHHSSKASTYGTATLLPQAQQAAEAALREICRHTQWGYKIEELRKEVAKGDDLAPANGQARLTIPSWERDRLGELETWLYFVIVHALRLADQRASRW